MKKFLAVLAMVALIGTFAFAQEVSFTNKLHSNIVNVDQVGNKSEAGFAGVWEQMEVNVASEKVDLYAKARITLKNKYVLDRALETDPDKQTSTAKIGYDFSNVRLGITFKPGLGFGVGLGTEIDIPGAYLFVEDDILGAGDLGSRGLVLGYSGKWGGFEGLTVTGTIDFDMYGDYAFFAQGWREKATTETKRAWALNSSIGAMYEFEDLFSVGAKFSYLYDGTGFAYNYNPFSGMPKFGKPGTLPSLSLGVYGRVTPIDGLNLNVGYTLNPKDSLGNDDISLGFDGDGYYRAMHRINFSAMYEWEGLTVGLDYVTAVGHSGAYTDMKGNSDVWYKDLADAAAYDADFAELSMIAQENKAKGKTFVEFVLDGANGNAVTADYDVVTSMIALGTIEEMGGSGGFATYVVTNKDALIGAKIITAEQLAAMLAGDESAAVAIAYALYETTADDAEVAEMRAEVAKIINESVKEGLADYAVLDYTPVYGGLYVAYAINDMISVDASVQGYTYYEKFGKTATSTLEINPNLYLSFEKAGTFRVGFDITLYGKDDPKDKNHYTYCFPVRWTYKF